MKIKIKPLSEINAEAMALLYKEMGVVNTTRFINQFTEGYGDYTKERHGFLAELTQNDIVSSIKQNRGKVKKTR